MASEQDPENTPEEPVESAPEQPEAQEQAPESAEASAVEESSDAPSAEEAPATEASEQAAPAAAPTPAPAAEVLAPKERRRRARAAKAPASRGPVSHEERQAERDALRAAAAHARRHARAKARAAKPPSAAAPQTEAAEHVHGRKKVRQGIVVSDKAAKTITVRVDTSRRHVRYKKIVRSSKTLHAHDEGNEAHEGDLVRVIETRPLSASKRWRLVEVLERAK
jgi:small subunit ribosomal protein S17